MKIFVLNTNLFPEEGMLVDALAQLGLDHEISRCDASAETTDVDWDHVVQEIISADRIICL